MALIWLRTVISVGTYGFQRALQIRCGAARVSALLLSRSGRPICSNGCRTGAFAFGSFHRRHYAEPSTLPARFLQPRSIGDHSFPWTLGRNTSRWHFFFFSVVRVLFCPLVSTVAVRRAWSLLNYCGKLGELVLYLRHVSWRFLPFFLRWKRASLLDISKSPIVLFPKGSRCLACRAKLGPFVFSPSGGDKFLLGAPSDPSQVIAL